MGIADGVGGWSRSNNSNIHPTPSALFAKRLMHNCVLELAVPPLLSASPLASLAYFASKSQPKPERMVLVRPMDTLPFFRLTTSSRQSSLETELEDELEQLSQGIDVLQILERAYDNTLKSAQSPKTLNNNGHAQEGGRQDETAGSSTALLAVLDHLPRYSDVASASASGGVENGPGTMKNYAAGSMSISFTTEEADKEMGYDAAIRIVHVGDCMGMLVRDEDIVWRTEEMWWNVRSFSFILSPSSSFRFVFHSFSRPFLFLPSGLHFLPYIPPPFLAFIPVSLLPHLLSSLILTPFLPVQHPSPTRPANTAPPTLSNGAHVHRPREEGRHPHPRKRRVER
jgi:hypothetical protein